MNTIVNKQDIFKLTYDILKNLDSIKGLIERIEENEGSYEYSLEKHNLKIEKEQCLQAVKDFIEIIKDETNKITENCNEKEILSNCNYVSKLVSGIKMRDTRALIVDDNSINNYVVKQMLSSFDIDVDVAISGEEALELYKKKDYDLVLMDYQMPGGMDGIETVKHIRESGEKGKRQLIIGLTAYTIEEFKKGLNDLGVELIIFKPVKFQQMSVILQKELSEKVINL